MSLTSLAVITILQLNVEINWSQSNLISILQQLIWTGIHLFSINLLVNVLVKFFVRRRKMPVIR